MGEVAPDQQGRSDRQFACDPAIGNIRSGSVKSGPKTAGRVASLRRLKNHGAGQTTRNALVAILDEQHLNDTSGLICTKAQVLGDAIEKLRFSRREGTVGEQNIRTMGKY